MKSSTTLNQSIFRKFGGSTKSISSSMIVCHPLEVGTYHGVVYHNNKQVGSFVVHSREGAEVSQADLDLSEFIFNTSKPCDCCAVGKIYSIVPGGYAVFFSSRGEQGFSVELSSEKIQKGEKPYSTQELRKGDVVIAMVLRPGVYEVSANNQKAELKVDVPKDLKDYQKILATPIAISLSDKGFSKGSLVTMPGQGLVINLEVGGSVDLKLLKATEIKVEPKRTITHRWVKPQTPVFKKKRIENK